jgi:hypothetical protein
VYIKEQGSFSKSYVSTGIKNEFLVEITKGLNNGDIIALSIPEQLNDAQINNKKPDENQS